MALTPDHIRQICTIDQDEKPTLLAAMMTKPAFQGLGIFDNDYLQGFIYGWSVDGEGEIVQITVAKDYRRQGFGIKLMQSFLQENHLTACYLDVKEDNHAAFSLYQRIGFVEDGERKGYYQSATDDSKSTRAILMQWKRQDAQTSF